MKITPPIALFAAALLLGGCSTGGAEAPTATPTTARATASATATASAAPTSTPTPSKTATPKPKTKTTTTPVPVDDIDAEEVAAGVGAGSVDDIGAYPGCPDKVTNLGRPVPIICGKSVSDMSPAERRRKYGEVMLWLNAVEVHHVDE